MFLNIYNDPETFLRALIHMNSSITPNKSMRLLLLFHSTDEKAESQRSKVPNPWLIITLNLNPAWRPSRLKMSLPLGNTFSEIESYSPLKSPELSHGVEATVLNYSDLCTCQIISVRLKFLMTMVILKLPLFSHSHRKEPTTVFTLRKYQLSK